MIYPPHAAPAFEKTRTSRPPGPATPFRLVDSLVRERPLPSRVQRAPVQVSGVADLTKIIARRDRENAALFR